MFGKISQTKNHFSVDMIVSAIIRNIYETFDYPGDMHDFWEMVYVIDGNATITEDENVYLMTSGNVIFHRPMEFHKLYIQYQQNSPTKIMILSFKCSGSAIESLGDGLFMMSDSQQKDLIDMYNTIMSTYKWVEGEGLVPINAVGENAKKLDEMIVYSKLTVMLLTLAKNLLPVKSEELQTRVSSGIYNYKRMMEILNEHIYEDLSVDDIASMGCMSRSNVQKLFKTYSGCGVMQQFNRIKVAKAMDLIKMGMNINEISSRLAYTSPNYFSEVFKREVGVLPSRFKQQVQSFVKQSDARDGYK
ncbi:MAG: helix-turn-helix domain-containing protein [Ruminococcaceae bacterium]|nr:helix-turn-helix domain-containing protein [Oscillospiraceae bacterium]